MFKKIALLAGILAMVVGCSGGYGDENAPSGATAATSAHAKLDSAAPIAADDPILASNPNKQPSTPTSVANRLVVRAASLQVRVQSIDDSEKKVDAAIKSAGGYLETVSSDDLASSNATLTIQAKVPVDKFDDTIAKLESLGTRLSKTVSMQDVTDPVLGLNAKIKQLRSEEQSPRKDNQGINLRAELAVAQAERDAQAKAAAFATVNLNLKQGAVAGNLHDPSWLTQALGSASNSAGEAFRIVATVFLWLLFFSPFYVPVGIAAWLLRKAHRRKLAGAS